MAQKGMAGDADAAYRAFITDLGKSLGDIAKDQAVVDLASKLNETWRSLRQNIETAEQHGAEEAITPAAEPATEPAEKSIDADPRKLVGSSVWEAFRDGSGSRKTTVREVKIDEDGMMFRTDSGWRSEADIFQTKDEADAASARMANATMRRKTIRKALGQTLQGLIAQAKTAMSGLAPEKRQAYELATEKLQRALDLVAEHDPLSGSPMKAMAPVGDIVAGVQSVLAQVKGADDHGDNKTRARIARIAGLLEGALTFLGKVKSAKARPLGGLSSMDVPAGDGYLYVVRVNRDPRDTHAGRTLREAMDLANADEGDKIEYAIVEGDDAGAARLVEPGVWIRFLGPRSPRDASASDLAVARRLMSAYMEDLRAGRELPDDAGDDIAIARSIAKATKSDTLVRLVDRVESAMEGPPSGPHDKLLGLRDAIESFPEKFGLKGFPGKTFKISRHSSYINDAGEFMLYTMVDNGDGQWLDFAKGTPEELRREIVMKSARVRDLTPKEREGLTFDSVAKSNMEAVRAMARRRKADPKALLGQIKALAKNVAAVATSFTTQYPKMTAAVEAADVAEGLVEAADSANVPDLTARLGALGEKLGKAFGLKRKVGDALEQLGAKVKEYERLMAGGGQTPAVALSARKAEDPAIKAATDATKKLWEANDALQEWFDAHADFEVSPTLEPLLDRTESVTWGDEESDLDVLRHIADELPDDIGDRLRGLADEAQMAAQDAMPAEGDITTEDGERFYHDGDLIASSEEDLRDWMERESYWPTVWMVDDHGGATPYSMDRDVEKATSKELRQYAKDLRDILEASEDREDDPGWEDESKDAWGIVDALEAVVSGHPNWTIDTLVRMARRLSDNDTFGGWSAVDKIVGKIAYMRPVNEDPEKSAVKPTRANLDDEDEDEDDEEAPDIGDFTLHLDLSEDEEPGAEEEGWIGTMVTVHVEGPGAAAAAKNDQSIMGSSWETDGDDFAYTSITNEDDLPAKLEAEGYKVDDSMWGPPEKLNEHGKSASISKAEAESVGVFVKIPKDIAASFPSLGEQDDSPPHITVLYVGKEAADQKDAVLDAVRGVLAGMEPFEVKLADAVDYFEPSEHSDGMKPAFVPVESGALGGLHEDLKGAMEAAGVQVDDHHPDYRPHATLAYLEPEAEYEGEVPAGAWTVDEVEVWGFGKPVRVKLGEVDHTKPPKDDAPEGEGEAADAEEGGEEKTEKAGGFVNLGDASPMEYGGFLVNKETGAAWYWDEPESDSEDPNDPIYTVYRFTVEDDPMADLSWMEDDDWERAAETIGSTVEDIRAMAAGDITQKAEVYRTAASLWGWQNIDSYPETWSANDMDRIIGDGLEAAGARIPHWVQADDEDKSTMTMVT